MRVTREDGGGARIRLDGAEIRALAALVTDLVDTLRPGALELDDPVHQRLYPAAYPADEQAAAEFRELTETSLRDDRTARAEQVLADLAGAQPHRRLRDVALAPQLEITLDADGGSRWIRVLNDIRLARGTRLGVSEDDDWGAVPDPGDPRTTERAAYDYLTVVQDGLVRALMG